ncbi:MAG: hypothetical protein U1F20_03345 [Lysobacterales bacterium]
MEFSDDRAVTSMRSIRLASRQHRATSFCRSERACRPPGEQPLERPTAVVRVHGRARFGQRGDSQAAMRIEGFAHLRHCADHLAAMRIEGLAQLHEGFGHIDEAIRRLRQLGFRARGALPQHFAFAIEFLQYRREQAVRTRERRVRFIERAQIVVPSDRREVRAPRQSDRFRQRRAIVAMVPAFLPDDAAIDASAGRFPQALAARQARNPPHHASRVREQFVVTDERSRQAAGCAFGIQRMPQPEQQGLAVGHAVADRERPCDFLRMAREQQHRRRATFLGERAQPQFREQAHPRILDRPQRMLRQARTQVAADLRTRDGRRIGPHPVARQRAQIVPSMAERGQQPFVGFDREGVFPVALLVAEAARHQALAGIGAGRRQQPRQHRGSAAMHAEHEETRAVAGVRSGGGCGHGASIIRRDRA